VQSGKITREQLSMLKRNEAAHQNAVENFPLLVGSLLFAHISGVSVERINASALVYTVVRLAYAALYIFGTSTSVSAIRTAAWWTGNMTCLRLLWMGGKLINGR